MKQFLGTLGIFFLSHLAFGQQILTGKVTDTLYQALNGATIEWSSGKEKRTTITNENGAFQLKVPRLSKAFLTVQFTGHGTVVYDLNEDQNEIVIRLQSKALFLDPLEVKAIRAADKAPFARSGLNKAQIEKLNTGQDVPFLLNQLPSVVVNSDAGNGVGYTGIRIRGSDPTRINVTVNGIPYNDAESQGTFFVDMPDIASSLNSIQVQRGVGASSNGAGAFGATINLSTNELNEKAYGELNNSYGSFNTWKHTAKLGTGLINDHFTFDARLSQISSDGYIDRASSALRSFYVSGAYITKKASVRLNVFSGKERTYQAWNGVPEWMLNTNRRYNSSGTERTGDPYDNEIDNYQQNHYQLFYNQGINKDLSLQVAAFLTRGFGYYEQYKASQRYSNYSLPDPVINGAPVTRTDLVRQLWLDNHFYGNNASLHYKKQDDQLTIGAAWNQYDGKHYGKVIWANTSIPKDHKWYDTKANKTDISSFVKWQHTYSTALSSYADVQIRNVDHSMEGFRNNPALFIDRSFTFLNPKFGLHYQQNNWQSYISYALAAKEPNRDDFEASTVQQPKAERLHDIELGTEKKWSNASVAVNAYYMYYKDQLILTGKINDVGAYTRTNVPNSYRAGVELSGTLQATSWMNILANASFSKNKISNFTEFYDNYDNNDQGTVAHTDKNIAFSPSTIANLNMSFLPLKGTAIQLISKYVGKQYLDNTQNDQRSLDAFFVQDMRIDHQFTFAKNIRVNMIFQLNNVLNTKYEPNGYTFSYVAGGNFTTENYYFPMAGRNFLATINIRF